MRDEDPTLRSLGYFGISAAIGLALGAVITFLILSCLTQSARAKVLGLPDLPRGSQSKVGVLTKPAASAPLDPEVCSSIAHDSRTRFSNDCCNSPTVSAASSPTARSFNEEHPGDCTPRAHSPMEATIIADLLKTPSKHGYAATTSKYGSLPHLDSFIDELVSKGGHVKCGRPPPISLESHQAISCLQSSGNRGHETATTIGSSDLDEELCLQV